MADQQPETSHFDHDWFASEGAVGICRDCGTTFSLMRAKARQTVAITRVVYDTPHTTRLRQGHRRSVRAASAVRRERPTAAAGAKRLDPAVAA